MFCKTHEDYKRQEHLFELTARLGDLYVSYRGRYVVGAKGRYYVPKLPSGAYKTLKDYAFSTHLNGGHAICVYSGSAYSKFITFDVDIGKDSEVHRLIDAIEDYGFPRDKIYVSTSGRKGWHVDIIFDGMMLVSELKAFYDYVCITGGFNQRRIEFRPTHTNSIKIPLSRHPTTGNICWYVDRETLEPIEDYDYIFQIQKMSAEEARKIIAAHEVPKIEPSPPKPTTKELANEYEGPPDFSEGYPTLSGAGETHKTIVAIAVFERYRQTPPQKIEARLLDWIYHQKTEYLTDPLEHIEKDIHDAVDYVWGKRFLVRPRSIDGKDHVTITAEDVLAVMAQPSKGRRRIYLYLLYCFARWGSCRMSQEKIGEMVGLSERMVATNISELCEEKFIISTTKRVMVNKTGILYKPANEYTPGPVKDTVAAKTLADSVEITDDIITPDMFRAMWRRVMNIMLAEEDQRRFLTAGELKELRAEERKGEQKQ